MEKVEVLIKNGIGEISFFNPKGNSLNSKILKGLTASFDELSKNDEVKLIVLKSLGEGAFCGGAAINEMKDLNEYSHAEKYFLNFSDLIKSIITNTKLIICRVHGKVVGGGVGLISACDFVIANNLAEVRLSEFAIGIGPFVISPVLEKRMGNSALKSLTLDYDWHSAEWAYNKGLYDKIVNNNSDLDKVVNEHIAKISQGNSETASELKKIFWSDANSIIQTMNKRAEQSARLLISEHTQNQLNNFLKE